MNIFTFESFMDDTLYTVLPDEYMTEGIREVGSSIKDFFKKILEMISNFITECSNRFKRFIAEHQIKEKLNKIMKLPMSVFGDKTEEVPDINAFQKTIKVIGDNADKALDALASRNPFYIRSYEAADVDSEARTKRMKIKDILTKVIPNMSKDVDTINSDVDKTTKRIISKSENVVNKNPQSQEEVRGIVVRVTDHLKKHALKYIGAILATVTLIKVWGPVRGAYLDQGISMEQDRIMDRGLLDIPKDGVEEYLNTHIAYKGSPQTNKDKKEYLRALDNLAKKYEVY